ncbi:MAG: hypothetical protein OIN87_09050 [Candidatus Methanoperedens sp.]|nr:hypothetical protein [Candidatus Methanoperedens sp.]
MNEDHHLSKQFSKPEDGEYVPITFIEFKRKIVGWSNELKRSVYIENEEQKSTLKRVREINLMIVINHLSGKTSSIELTDDEKAQFEAVYNTFLKKGGMLMYTRKRIGAKKVSFFELKEQDRVIDAPLKNLLSEMF